MTVPPGAAMFLHDRFGAPGLLLAGAGFWATLHAAPGRLWLVRGKDVIEIPEIEDVGTGPSDNGRGTWTQAVIVTSHGESLPLMPYEKHGLLPHTVQDPTAIASEIRSVVFGA
ncbi:hypothetical protein AXZ95_3764 [Leifsonia sp. 115AMFTsu3.1]|nr:hypothetical protein AXZ95_3764 [Leifsonia sp. 115AMFTsu3.1]